MRDYYDSEGNSILEVQMSALKSIQEALSYTENEESRAKICECLVSAMHELNTATMIDIEDDELYDEGYDDACVEFGICPCCGEAIEDCTCGFYDCDGDCEDCDGCDDEEDEEDEEDEDEEECDAYTEGYRDGCFAAGVCPDCGKPIDECDCGGRDEYEESLEYTKGYNDALKANGICPDCGFPLDECTCNAEDDTKE